MTDTLTDGLTGWLNTLVPCRFINLLNMLNTYLFTAIALIIAIFQSAKYDLPRDYGVHGTNADKAFGVFQGIVIMHFVYG